MPKLVVQVKCSAMGWVDSKYSGTTYAEALTAEKALLADDSAWVDREAPRQTRIAMRVADEKIAN